MAVSDTYEMAGLLICAAMQKVCHRGWHAAKRARRQHQMRKPTSRMTVFRCKECGFIHYGHPKGKRGNV